MTTDPKPLLARHVVSQEVATSRAVERLELERIDLAEVGVPMALCDFDCQLLALSPTARALLSHAGVTCEPLPVALPPTLSEALSKAPLGHSTDWRPPNMEYRCIGFTRYRYGDSRALLLMREITDAQNELRRRLQQQRLEAIGRLIAGIAHDLRAPLSSIMFAANVLAQRLHELEPQQLREKMEQIAAAAARQQATIAGLLDFARLGPPVKGEVRVAETFSRVLALMRSSLREGGHQVAVSVQPDAEIVYGNPLVIEQVLVNLLVNAVEAAARPVHVELRATPADDGTVDIHVIDDGPGVPLHLRDRIFEPFFTTKPNGTGLGLVTAREAAVDQGGTLVLAPSEHGAHFVLGLPCGVTGITREFPRPDEAM